MADIYNENGVKEQYLKKHGILLTDFGGDISGQIFRTRCGGIKILLVFDRVDEDGLPIFRAAITQELKEYEINSDDLGCDSGSYIFLDYNQNLQNLFDEELKNNYLFLIDLSPGSYNVGYEQWDTNDDNPYESWRRNIIVWQ